MKNNAEKNNKNNNDIPAEMVEPVEIKRKRGRPKKIDNNNLIQLKNKNNSEKNIIISGSDNQDVKRGRGRPKGTTGITRKDNIQNIVPDEVKQKLLRFNTAVYHLPRVNREDPFDIKQRIDLFFELCEEYAVQPTVATFAMSLGIDRTTLWTWITNKNDVIKNKESIDMIKSAYTYINSSYELLLTEGKIVPVSAFFLMQNNHGYKQQTDHVITANVPDNVTDNDIMNKAGLLD